MMFVLQFIYNRNISLKFICYVYSNKNVILIKFITGKFCGIRQIFVKIFIKFTQIYFWEFLQSTKLTKINVYVNCNFFFCVNFIHTIIMVFFIEHIWLN